MQCKWSNCSMKYAARSSSYLNSGCGVIVGMAPFITPRSLRDRKPFGSSNAFSLSNTDALQHKVHDLCRACILTMPMLNFNSAELQIMLHFLIPAVHCLWPWFWYKPAEINVLNQKPMSVLQALNQNAVDPLKTATVVQWLLLFKLLHNVADITLTLDHCVFTTHIISRSIIKSIQRNHVNFVTMITSFGFCFTPILHKVNLQDSFVCHSRARLFHAPAMKPVSLNSYRGTRRATCVCSIIHWSNGWSNKKPAQSWSSRCVQPRSPTRPAVLYYHGSWSSMQVGAVCVGVQWRDLP